MSLQQEHRGNYCRGYISMAEACMLKRGLCMGMGPRGTLSFGKRIEGPQTMEPSSIPEDV